MVRIIKGSISWGDLGFPFYLPKVSRYFVATPLAVV